MQKLASLRPAVLPKGSKVSLLMLSKTEVHIRNIENGAADWWHCPPASSDSVQVHKSIAGQLFFYK